MSRPSKPTRHSVLPTQVWTCLAPERRSEVIRLMAQLAFKLVNAQAASFRQEAIHVVRPDTHQNSLRPS
jgi:hypothetical protein